MPARHRNLESNDALATLLGPRQADVMQLLWTRGPATVRQLLSRLPADPPITYQTIMTVCLRLTERGLLERRRATNADESARHGQAYVYAPRMSRDEFLREAHKQQIDASPTADPVFVPKQNAGCDRAQVEHILAEQGMLRDTAGQCTDDAVLDTITALLERAERAERTAMSWEARAHHTELQVQAAERRAIAAERRAEQAERRLETLRQQLNRPHRPERTRRAPLGIIVEHHDPSGICRVCAQPAPPASAARHDDLRVCVAEACRQEGRRRDTVAKQRRYNARRSAGAEG